MVSRILISALRLNRIILQSTKQNLSASYCVAQNDGQLPLNNEGSSGVSRQYIKKRTLLTITPALNVSDLLKKLKVDVDNLGYINYKNISKFTEFLNDETLTIKDDDVTFLLESAHYMPSITKELRMGIFDKIWTHLKNNNQLNRTHYLLALKVFQENTVPLANVCSILDKSGLDKDSQIYEELIMLACEHGNIEQATEILAEMSGKNLQLTVNIFNALIRGYSRNKEIDQCKQILETMNATGILPNSDTYSELLMAYIEIDQQDEIQKILETHSGTFSTQQILKIIKFAANKNIITPIANLLKQLSSDWIHVNEVPPAIRNICTELIYKKCIEEAFSILDGFPKQEFTENQNLDTFGAFFLKELIQSGAETKQVIEVCLNLISSEKNTRALHVACEIALKRRPDEALDYLKALAQQEPLRPHYFWPLILYSYEQHGEIGVLNILKEMINLKVEVDYETLSQYVLPRLTLTLENEKEGLKTLEDCGIRTSQMLTPVILNLIQQHNFKTVITLSQLYPTKLDTSKFVNPLAKIATSNRFSENYSIFAEVITALSKKSENLNYDFVGEVLLGIIAIPKSKKNPQLLIRIIDELKLFGGNISLNAADVISEYLTKNVPNDSSEAIQLLKEMVTVDLYNTNAELGGVHIAHPRDMNLNELECHLIELESKGLNTRGVLRRLLQVCVKEGRKERALEIKNQCDNLKVQMSPGMLASLFDMQTKFHNFEEAENTLKQIQTNFPEFQIDEYKIIDYATLLVKNNKITEAKEVMNNYVKSKKIIGGDNIFKNLWNLLNQIAITTSQSDSPPEFNTTKDFFNFLHKSGFCPAHNTLLGPIIREWILRKDIKSAVDEFVEIAEKYKRTPLQFEMLSLLVGFSNSKNIKNYKITPEAAKNWLQILTTKVAQIHGTVNMNNSLLLAVAESGFEKQIRKMLINPEFKINSDSLVKNCEHLSTSGKLNTLLKLAKASRGLSRAIKEEDIYNLLLKNFIKENDIEAAINLFNTLEADDDLKISQEFVRNLVRFLKINNQELPSNVALRAQIF